MASEAAQRSLEARRAARVSAVSPDWETTITRVPGSRMKFAVAEFRGEFDVSVGMPASDSKEVFPGQPGVVGRCRQAMMTTWLTDFRISGAMPISPRATSPESREVRPGDCIRERPRAVQRSP